MTLFAGLRKIRELERVQLPFFKSIVDFDIVIEIGYEEERGRPMTMKQLLLLNICSRTTVRRKLTQLIDRGVVARRRHDTDRRASFLVIPPATMKLLSKYGGALTSIAASHFG